MDTKVYNGSFQVPAEGGVFEFKCADDQFYISRIFDSSMPRRRADYPATDDYQDVNDLTYSGAFYTITCNKDKHNWVITVDPLMAIPGEFSSREIRVFMWDGSDDSHFVFRFEQSDYDSLGYIEPIE